MRAGPKIHSEKLPNVMGDHCATRPAMAKPDLQCDKVSTGGFSENRHRCGGDRRTIGSSPSRTTASGSILRSSRTSLSSSAGCIPSLPGTGIGLSICKRIVERHGGTPLGRDPARGGARFRFSMPKAETRVCRIVNPDARGAHPGPAGRRQCRGRPPGRHLSAPRKTSASSTWNGSTDSARAGDDYRRVESTWSSGSDAAQIARESRPSRGQPAERPGCPHHRHDGHR